VGDQPIVEGEGGDEAGDPGKAGAEGWRVGGCGVCFFGGGWLLESFGGIVLNAGNLAVVLHFRFEPLEIRPRIVEHQQESRPEKAIETRHIDAFHRHPRVYRAAYNNRHKDGDI
jgi:hypothetical protein